MLDSIEKTFDTIKLINLPACPHKDFEVWQMLNFVFISI